MVVHPEMTAESRKTQGLVSLLASGYKDWQVELTS